MPARTTKAKPKVLGERKTSEVIKYMKAVGDPRAPAAQRALRQAGRDVEFYKLAWPWPPKKNEEPPKPPWEKQHQFGYFGTTAGSKKDVLNIIDAGAVEPDPSLKNQRVRITLDRLRAADYPGTGNHTVLVEFTAIHVVPGNTEQLKFAQKYQVSEGSGAGVRGYPIFVGLAVSAEGISLDCRTINIENSDDQGILAFLDEPVFKQGLKLLNSVNPVIPVVTSFATGLTKVFASRNQNVPVQEFRLGLDFSGVPSRAYLREGSYIIVQARDQGWDWSEWQFTRSTGKLTNKTTKKLIPRNYLVIGVSKMDAESV